MERKDVFISAKTGSGKSLCFQGISTVCKLLGRPGSITIVVSPLVSLMESQVGELTTRGISATYIGKDHHENMDIMRGKYSYVYSNPEKLMKSQWRNMLQSDIYKTNLTCIVFDEAHTAVSWGMPKGEEAAFRAEFSKVGELRASVPDCPFMALTATASSSVRKTIKTLLAMKNVEEFTESPDRENIKISVTKLAGDPLLSFQWLAEQLKEEREKCEKVLIYCRRISDCSSIYRFLEDEVSDCTLYQMFHSRTVKRVKDTVLETIKDPDSKIRVLIATNAVGMGLDFNINLVINYGPPSEFNDYLQQIGRVGRDGSRSHAVLAYHGQQLRKLSPEMLSVVKGDKCRRVLLRTLYGADSEHSVKGCHCCDICEKTCHCGD